MARCLAWGIYLCRIKSLKRCAVVSLTLLGFYLIISVTTHSSWYGVEKRQGKVAISTGKQDVSQWMSLLQKERKQFVSPHTTPPATPVSVLPRLLLLYDKDSSATSRSITTLLQSHRISYDAHLFSKETVSSLVDPKSGGSVGKYCLIVCATVDYLDGPCHQQHYLNYARHFNVTIIQFASSSSSSSSSLSPKGSDRYLAAADIEATDVLGVRGNPALQFYYLKTEEWFTDIPQGKNWIGFVLADSAHWVVEVLVHAKVSSSGGEMASFGGKMAPVAILCSSGQADGTSLRKILIGSPIKFWMSQLLLLEVVRTHSAQPLARFGRKRWIMIDIDDIFVAPEGLKMNSADVEALISAQDSFRQYVPKLTFNLGFCGYYFAQGSEAEKNGSVSLVKNTEKFWWFGHIYNHYQPHIITEEKLRTFMKQNLVFANNHSISSKENGYSVSPHHSGVYPPHIPLYQAWVELLNVSMTTTEEYPHLYPSYRRRGYIYKGVMVVPRQTCRLFTHNYLFDDFGSRDAHASAQGKEGLRGVARGGELFQTILYNPISIFMTHVTNYAKDRLAIFLFENVFQFISRWTQLELRTDRPLNLGKRYFSLFPEERHPLWTSPCSDKRHMEIWGRGGNCTNLPEAVILGPQKTGSTALHLFLSSHPNMSTSYTSPDKYEEVQFFSDESLYMKNVDWYLDQFPYPGRHTQLTFEKSATYFAAPKGPERLRVLLPKAKLVVILHDPIKRAYSWYQHMRAHADDIALTHTFLQVLIYKPNHTHPGANHTHSETNPVQKSADGLTHLRAHCLEPGRYYKYIMAWLKKFPSAQLSFVDGTALRVKPVQVLTELQSFLKVDYFDYNNVLSFSQKKGHYCIMEQQRLRCLGPGKGRLYPQLQPAELAYLKDYYSNENRALAKLLQHLKRPLPSWLATHHSASFKDKIS